MFSTSNDSTGGSSQGVVIINSQTAIKGSIRRCKRFEVMGYMEGDLVADDLIVHPGGRVVGRVKSKTARIEGVFSGDLVVDGLLRIAGNGSVRGTVQYGRLAMEATADLEAEVRNVPPRLAGDFEVTVVRGRSVRITPDDITAIDPDDPAGALTFEVSDEVGGVITLMGDRTRPAGTFTQADLVGGRVTFVHDGNASPSATFSVMVRDRAGATSGEPKAVRVIVTPSATGAAGVPMWR